MVVFHSFDVCYMCFTALAGMLISIFGAVRTRFVFSLSNLGTKICTLLALPNTKLYTFLFINATLSHGLTYLYA